MMGAVQPASRMRFLISGTAAAASGTFTVQRTISEPASANSTVCLKVDSMSAVSVLVIDWTTIGALLPTWTCPTFTPYVLRRGWRVADASNPSICASIPYNSSLIPLPREILGDAAKKTPNLLNSSGPVPSSAAAASLAHRYRARGPRNVPKHQESFQFRSTGHSGRGSRRLFAIRKKNQRLSQAFQGQ